MNKKRLQKLEPFFAVSKHRANRIFHKFTFSSWLQQILILGDSSQLHQTVLGRHEQRAADFLAGLEAIHKHQCEPFPFFRREVRLEVVHRKKKLPQ